MSRKIPKKTVEKIRKKVLSGKSKYQVAKEYNVSDSTVYKYTKDIAKPKIKGPVIKGKQLELFKKLLRDGYVYTGDNRNYLRGLQKHFPMIQRSQFKNRSIYYLEGKNKKALKEMIRKQGSRVVSFHDLSDISKVFQVDLSSKEKKESINNLK
jgi:hypothetical protein